MDPQITAAIVTVILTAVAGAGGYFVKTWLTQARPFVRVVAVNGGFTRGHAEVQVPDPLVNALKNVPGTLLNALSPTDTLAEVHRCRRSARLIERDAPQLIEYLEAFEKAVVAGEISSATSMLAKALSTSASDKWLTPLIGDNIIQIPAPEAGLPSRIPFGDTNAQNGALWIGFPGEGVNFGQELNDFPAFRYRLHSFAKLIEGMEYEKVKLVVSTAKNVIHDTLKTAKDALPILNRLSDENSQWGIRLYAANIGPTPFLLNQHATLHVLDSNGASYDEECYLVLLTKKGTQLYEREEASSPLVLRSENDAEFEFFTKNTQKSMKRGDAFRDAFNSRHAKCWIDFSLEQIGISTKVSVKTERAPFQEE